MVALDGVAVRAMVGALRLMVTVWGVEVMVTKFASPA